MALISFTKSLWAELTGYSQYSSSNLSSISDSTSTLSSAASVSIIPRSSADELVFSFGAQSYVSEEQNLYSNQATLSVSSKNYSNTASPGLKRISNFSNMFESIRKVESYTQLMQLELQPADVDRIAGWLEGLSLERVRDIEAVWLYTFGRAGRL